MTISKKFIQKPILTIVISILILIGGLISLQQIAIESIPSIAPPTIKVKAQWPGASAETIEQAVTIPLEQAVNGVENVDYIRSGSMQGSSEIALYFKNGTDNNINQVNVTNKANKAVNGQNVFHAPDTRLCQHCYRQPGLSTRIGQRAAAQVRSSRG